MILIYSDQVKNFVRSLHPDIKKGIKETIEALAKNHLAGKPLYEDLAGFWSVAYKRYRIIYKPLFDKENIQVYFAGHRDTVYKELSRLVRKEETRDEISSPDWKDKLDEAKKDSKLGRRISLEKLKKKINSK